MGIVLTIGKKLASIAIKLVVIGGVLYIEYRLSGGPAIRKTIKQFRKEYDKTKDDMLKEQIKQAAKEGKIIYLDPEKVV